MAKKYGYICMTCGKTIPKGVNKDGECTKCARNQRGNTIFGKSNGKMVLIATQTHKTLWD